ncbi:protocatechuate dioxygenase [Streptomyces canus]
MTGNHRNSGITRRRALAVTGGTVAAGGLAVTGYQSAFADTTDTAEATATGACMTLMSSVTEGPYYLDGALVRRDIAEGKSGVPLTLRLTVVDATDGCTPVKGAAVEIWHCDAWGYYSGYTTASPGGSAPAESEDGSTANNNTYLRGYQVANANGVVKSETIFPGWRTAPTRAARSTTPASCSSPMIAEETFTPAPYAQHSGTYTELADDMVCDGASSGLLTLKDVHKSDPSKGYKGTERAPSGGPPSGAPSGSASPSASASS